MNKRGELIGILGAQKEGSPLSFVIYLSSKPVAI